MSNMSYCRFQNTSSDLADCEGALADLFDNIADHPLSAEELRAAGRLIHHCFNIVERFKDAASAETGCDLPENDSARLKLINQVLEECNADVKDGHD